jgi:hypothetical protein
MYKLATDRRRQTQECNVQLRASSLNFRRSECPHDLSEYFKAESEYNTCRFVLQPFCIVSEQTQPLPLARPRFGLRNASHMDLISKLALVAREIQRGIDSEPIKERHW